MGKLKYPTYKRFITGPLERFDARNTVFSRNRREEMRTLGETNSKPLDKFRHLSPRVGRKGYEQKDYAQAWVGMTIDQLVRRNLYCKDLEVAKTKVDVSDKSVITQQVKTVARWIGADLVGICEVNPSWVYSHWGEHNASYLGGLVGLEDPVEIPSWIKYAVVMAIEMGYEEIKRSPAVEPATDFGYAQMAFSASSLATYIRGLGYHAMPCGNDFALNIPLAIDAGLGELGRHGLLITEPYGPRVRICSVFTELPLKIDPPINIGVQAFCERCLRCANACPSRAIMSGERTDKAWDVSNNINVLKWPIKALNCHRWWWDKNEFYCSNCIRVCPYNKPQGWLHSLVKKMVKTTPVFNQWFIKMDQAMGYGKQVIK